MTVRDKVMQGEIPRLCLLVATLAIGSASGSGACLYGQTWLDRERGECMPCTRCEPQRLVVKYPCVPHRNTICQPLHDAYIEPFDTAVDDISELSSDNDYEVNTSDDTGEVNWDVQTTSLTVAASGCVFFFVVVLFLSFHYSKQWKALKQALRADVRDMSAKLKLMEAGDTQAEPVTCTDHHFYCNIHAAKDAVRGPASSKKGLGNVYTQEKHST